MTKRLVKGANPPRCFYLGFSFDFSNAGIQQLLNWSFEYGREDAYDSTHATFLSASSLYLTNQATWECKSFR